MQRSKGWSTRVENCLCSIHWWKTSLTYTWSSRNNRNQGWWNKRHQSLTAWRQCLGNKNHRARSLHCWHLLEDREVAQLSRRKLDHSKRQPPIKERIWVNYAARRLSRIAHTRASLQTSREQLPVHSSKLKSKTQLIQIKPIRHQTSTTKPRGRTSRRTS